MRGWVSILLLMTASAVAQPPQGAWVQLAEDGRLLYRRDTLGDRLPDFAMCGYKGGAESIPEAPVRVVLSPGAGDDRTLIQNAINQVAAMTPDANGIRGAILLTAGEYQVSNTLNITAGGIVLRGEGASNAGTVLRATGRFQHTLVSIAGSGSRSIVSGTTRTITDPYVPVGARSFNVDSTSGLAVGHTVQVYRPCTTNWIDALGMDQLCCPPDSYPWAEGDRDLYWDRTIVRIEGNRVFLDAPISTAIDARYGGGTIRRYTWSGRIEKVGIEDIKGLSDYTGSTDESHAWTFIGITRAQNCWVRRVLSQYFGYSCVTISDAKWVSVLDSSCIDPISVIDGGRRYAFNLNGSQLCLVRGCYNRKDRHQYVTGSNTPGPNAFVDSSSDTAYSDAGPHHRWASGILWDRIVVNGNNINVQNRGNLGTGHGWAGANCVVWNCDADGGFVVQKPPTAYNWLIGSKGTIENGTVYVGPHDAGNYDSHGTNVFPSTLHGNQRRDAQQAAGVQVREYLFGDYDSFTGATATGDVVFVDSSWRTSLTAVAALPIRNLDHRTNGAWVAWTHTNRLDAGDTLLSGTLYIGLRGLVANAKTNLLYLDTVTNRVALSNFVGSVSTSGTTVVRIDLADQLASLADGRLNVAVQPNCAVDWSLLELRVAPQVTGTTQVVLSPVADAYVRDGSYGDQNFGTEAALVVKQTADGSGFQRRSLLKWDVTSVTGRIVHAKVRLFVNGASTNFTEHIVSVADNGWTETGVTWSNQPATGRRLGSWNPQPATPFEFPVTVEADSARLLDGLLSLQVACINDPNGLGFIDYSSREAPATDTRPQLILTLASLPNTRPTISDVTNRVIVEDSATPALPFIVGDAETDPEDLTVTASSSNPALLPPYGIVLGGTGADRTVTLTPADHMSGTTTVSLLVSDGSLTATDTFTLVVSPVNDVPVLTDIGDRTLVPGTNTGALALYIADIETSATALTVTVTSSDPLLVPAGGISLQFATNPWTSADIGQVAVAGVGTPGDIATIVASGADIWNASDEGHFLFQTMTNDGELVARVLSLTPTDPWAKGGVMVRENDTPESANAYMLVSASNGVSFQRRKISGDPTVSTRVTGIAAPCWVRLVRWGVTNVAGFYATDTAGARGPWIQVGTNDAVDLTPTCLQGLAGTAHFDGRASTSRYDRISGPAEVGGNRTLRVTPAPDRYGTATITLVVGDGSTSVTQSFSLVVSPGGRTLRWLAATTSHWDLASANWQVVSNSMAASFLPGDLVLFDNTGAASNNVALVTNLMPAALHVSGSSNYTLGGSGRLMGTTAVHKVGSGVLTLGGTGNDFTGPVNVTGGTLRAGGATALGATNGTTTVGNGGRLDVNGQNLGREHVLLASGGWLVNDGAPQISALQHVTLTGAATVAGTNRFDIRSGTAAFLNLNGFTLTKTGTNQFSLVGTTATNNGDIVISNGIFSIETTSVVSGAGAIHVPAGGTLQYYQSPTVTKTNVLLGGRLSATAAGTVTPTVVLASNSTIETSADLSLAGPLTGPAGFTKRGSASLTLSSSNNFSGLAIVSNGTLALPAGATMGRTTVAGGLFEGAGTVRGDLTVSSGGTLAPGPGLAALTVTGTLQLAGTLQIEVNKSAGTSDVIAARTAQLGGTLVVSNLAGTFAAGDSFRIVVASNFTGAFTAIVPAQPAIGLAWNTAALTASGVLSVAFASPALTGSAAITNDLLVWSGTNGLPGGSYRIRASTNLFLAPTNWPVVTTNVFDPSGRFSFTNLTPTNAPARFFLLQTP